VNFEEYVRSRRGGELKEHARLAVDDTIAIMYPNIASGELDGTQISYHLSLLDYQDGQVGNAQYILFGRYVSVESDPYNGEYDYDGITARKHNDTLRTGEPVIILLRTRNPQCRSEYHGNAVIHLGLTLDAVISGSGLSQEGNQVFCLQVGANFQLRLLLAWRKDCGPRPENALAGRGDPRPASSTKP
jgi:hypothetical protein